MKYLIFKKRLKNHLEELNSSISAVVDRETPIGLDNVDHPKHYNQHPSGIECIEIVRHMTFNLGNAIKYIWRADFKNGLEDIKKAIWYLEDEIKKRENS